MSDGESSTQYQKQSAAAKPAGKPVFRAAAAGAGGAGLQQAPQAGRPPARRPSSQVLHPDFGGCGEQVHILCSWGCVSRPLPVAGRRAGSRVPLCFQGVSPVQMGNFCHQFNKQPVCAEPLGVGRGGLCCLLAVRDTPGWGQLRTGAGGTQQPWGSQPVSPAPPGAPPTSPSPGTGGAQPLSPRLPSGPSGPLCGRRCRRPPPRRGRRGGS